MQAKEGWVNRRQLGKKTFEHEKTVLPETANGSGNMDEKDDKLPSYDNLGYAPDYNIINEKTGRNGDLVERKNLDKGENENYYSSPVSSSDYATLSEKADTNDDDVTRPSHISTRF